MGTALDIKSLRLFQHLANSLHFSKTAEAMFVSAPTLSRVISRLEMETKSRLFERNNRRVKLTASGNLLLAFANKVLADFAVLRQNLDLAESALSGEVKLYCSVTASQSYLPEVLNKLRHQYPAVDIQLETGDHGLALDRLQNQRADLVLAIHTPDFPSHIEFQQIDTVPLTFIAPHNLAIEHLNSLDWQQTNMIMPAHGPAKRIVNNWFADRGLRPKVYAKVSGNEAIVSMVSLGLGVGFVPKIVLENSVVQSKVKSLAVPDIESYRLGLCYLKERANEALIKNIAELVVV